MIYWAFFSKFNKLLVKTYKDIAKFKNFFVVDGGALGQLLEPFNVARSVLIAIRFEPRGIDKVVMDNSDIYINVGLGRGHNEEIIAESI